MVFYEENKFELRIFRMKGNFSCYSHVHKQFELCFCGSGSMEVTCERKKYTLTENSWMIVLPEIEHSYLSSHDLDGVILIINPILIRHLSSYLNKKLLTPVIYGGDDTVERYLKDLLKENEKRYNKTVLKGFLYIILGLLFEQCEFTEPTENYDTDLCYNVIKYISAHFKEDISLTSIADHFRVNASYLSRAFHKKIGCGICDILHSYRIDYSKYLLSNTNMSVIDICFESGFSTQRNFNRWFDRLEGCTPNEYRISGREEKIINNDTEFKSPLVTLNELYFL